MIIFLFTLIILTTLIFGDNIELTSNINLWLCIALFAYNIIKDKYISVISIFIFGFIYIFFDEFLTKVPDLYLDWGGNNVNIGFRVIMFSFIGVSLGYYYRNLIRKPKNKRNDTLPSNSFYISKPKLFYKLNVVFVYLIFLLNLPIIIYGFTIGRPNAFEYGLFSNISYALCIIIIINLKIYYKQLYGEIKYMKLIVTTIPLFVLLFAVGTRYLLLYGIIALISDQLYNLSIKRILKLGLMFLAVVVAMNFIMQFRNSGLMSDNSFELRKKDMADLSFNQMITENFTNEGLLRNAAMITDYTAKEGYTYGKSIGFLGIFWIPRAVWNDKPTQIDYWLIRYYTNEYEASGHSTASGFMGEIYMDFGKYFTPLIMILFGWFLSFLNSKYVNSAVVKKDYKTVIISGSVLAWVFFMVRSILTSSYLFIFIILGVYVFQKIFFKWNILKS